MRGVHAEASSYVLPLFGGIANAFLEGPYAAATLVLGAALFRFVLPRERADVLGALVYALFYSCQFFYAPWGATLALSLGEAAVFLFAFRTLGLSGLLVAATLVAFLARGPVLLRFALGWLLAASLPVLGLWPLVAPLSSVHALLPLVGLAAGQFGGFLRAGPGYYALLGGFVLLLDVAILFAARRLFDRERLMSRWG